MTAPWGAVLTPGGGWRAALKKPGQPPTSATRARPSDATLARFLGKKPTTSQTMPPGLDATTAAAYAALGIDPATAAVYASLGLDPATAVQFVAMGLDPMAAAQFAAMGLDPMAAMYPQQPTTMYPMGAPGFFDPWAPWTAPSAALDPWQASQLYASQPSAWSSAYGGV